MVSIQTQQILIPKKVYIADKAELRCTFTTDAAFVRDATQQNDDINLSTSYFIRPLDSQAYEINSLKLTNSGANTYTLSITFMPWQTGEFVFPDYDLSSALNNDNEQLNLSFHEVIINSLAEENNISNLQESISPLLLPGTTYKIYGGIAVLLLFLIFLIRLIVKHKAVEFFFKSKLLQYKYNKNKKLTIKKLEAVRHNNTDSDKILAAGIQKIIREYLEVRFEYPFTRTVTSELMNSFYTSTQHQLSSVKEDAFIGIAETFIRTDYIRYSDNASFKNDEKSELINKLLRNIDIIEQPEKKEDKETPDA
ncbi:MAG: hypothetical protein K6E97_00250 [Treponema sp.]|nr:hypothetical protein [Treponema sp.]